MMPRRATTGPISAAPPVSTTDLASLSTSKLPVGSDAITAIFRGNASFATSTSATTTPETVTAASTTTILTTVRPNPATFGQNVTLVASVTAVPPGKGMPTGTVTFEEIGATTTTLGTATVRFGQAVFTTNALPVSTTGDTLEAIFNPGNTNFLTSSSPTVGEIVYQATPKVKITPATGSFPLAVGDNLTVSATVGLSSGFGFGFGPSCFFGGGGSGSTSTVTAPTGTLEFELNGTVLATDTIVAGQTSYSYTFLDLPQGTNVVTVVYSGDPNYTTATGTLNVTVPTPTTLTGSWQSGSGDSRQSLFANWGRFR